MTSFAYSSAINNLVGNTPGANVSNLVQCLVDLRTFLNSPNLDGTNIADIPESLLALAVQQKLGLNDGAQVGRGKSIIATTGTRTNTAYGQLSDGPDQVASVVLPTDGLLFVVAQMTWSSSVVGAGRAAVFVGSNQMKVSYTTQSAAISETVTASGANIDVSLATGPMGLTSSPYAAGTPYSGDVTTGQMVGTVPTIAGSQVVMGGPLVLFAAAGTYTVSVQFNATSGTVTAKNRRLWVWTMGF